MWNSWFEWRLFVWCRWLTERYRTRRQQTQTRNATSDDSRNRSWAVFESALRINNHSIEQYFKMLCIVSRVGTTQTQTELSDSDLNSQKSIIASWKDSSSPREHAQYLAKSNQQPVVILVYHIHEEDGQRRKKKSVDLEDAGSVSGCPLTGVGKWSSNRCTCWWRCVTCIRRCCCFR